MNGSIYVFSRYITADEGTQAQQFTVFAHDESSARALVQTELLARARQAGRREPPTDVQPPWHVHELPLDREQILVSLVT